MHAQLPKDFDSQTYYDLNPDVARAGVDAKDHYLSYGIHEGRKYKKDRRDDFSRSILQEYRLKYLPLLWQEATYSTDLIRLNFRVFDPCNQFLPNISSIYVNDHPIAFEFIQSDNHVDISFRLNINQYQTFFAKVDFDFYPYQLSRSWRQSWFIPLHIEDIKIPESNRLQRVIGDTRSSSYLVGGATHATHLAWLIERDLGLHLNKIKVLDWGCGCGRITQFLKKRGVSNLYGVDIDYDNIEWCQDNLKEISFAQIPYYPPTQFADSSFDAIVGISVMTHLTDETHKQWLKEINRILRPGGVALLSVRGFTYYHLFNYPLEVIYQINREGFLDRCRDASLDEVTEDAEYYRATYYSKNYIRNVWKQYFHIIDIIDGFVLQDLVVLRKPPN